MPRLSRPPQDAISEHAGLDPAIEQKLARMRRGTVTCAGARRRLVIPADVQAPTVSRRRRGCAPPCWRGRLAAAAGDGAGRDAAVRAGPAAAARIGSLNAVLGVSSQLGRRPGNGLSSSTTPLTSRQDRVMSSLRSQCRRWRSVIVAAARRGFALLSGWIAAVASIAVPRSRCWRCAAG